MEASSHSIAVFLRQTQFHTHLNSVIQFWNMNRWQVYELNNSSYVSAVIFIYSVQKTTYFVVLRHVVLLSNMAMQFENVFRTIWNLENLEWLESRCVSIKRKCGLKKFLGISVSQYFSNIFPMRLWYLWYEISSEL